MGSALGYAFEKLVRFALSRVAIAGHVIKLKCEIDQKREYIIVNGKATFSGLQTMW